MHNSDYKARYSLDNIYNMCYTYNCINCRLITGAFYAFIRVQRVENKWTGEYKVYKVFRKEGEQLENYTKYKLKKTDELESLLADKDNLFVIACNKCFKEFETVDEPDCG